MNREQAERVVQMAGRAGRVLERVEATLNMVAKRLEPTERLGRDTGGPRQLDGVFPLSVPGFARMVKRVPAAFFTDERVACPCGTETTVGRPRVWTACGGGCRRFFIAEGERAWSVGPFPEDPEDEHQGVDSARAAA